MRLAGLPRRSSEEVGYQKGVRLRPCELRRDTKVKIEVDERTAGVLRSRAAELGVTVPELVAELAALESEPIIVSSDEIAELDRRWKKTEATARTVPQERVVRWLRTWGTPRYRPWPGR